MAEGLCKSFGRTAALTGLDLRVAEGAVCGMLGPNGAGKTTAVHIFATLIRPDAGHAWVAGYDVVRDPGRGRVRIGLAGQHAAIAESLSAPHNLRMSGRTCPARPTSWRGSREPALPSWHASAAWRAWPSAAGPSR